MREAYNASNRCASIGLIRGAFGEARFRCPPSTTRYAATLARTLMALCATLDASRRVALLSPSLLADNVATVQPMGCSAPGMLCTAQT